MASIIDSFRDTFSDNLAFFKFIVFAVPIYFLYDLFLKGESNTAMFSWLFGILVFFLFGFLIQTTRRVLNEDESVLPPLNPVKFAVSSVKGLLAVAPIGCISYFLGNLLASFINIYSWVDVTLKSILWIVMASVPLTAFLMFIRRERVVDAYNLQAISDKAADLIVGIIFFIIQLFVANLVTTAFLGYVLYILFGFGPIFYFFASVAIVFNVGATGHYLAQLQYEVLGYDRENF